MSALNELNNLMLPEIEGELQRVVSLSNRPPCAELYHMMAYHLGWEGELAGPAARGKRVRPLLVLLTAAAAGGDWRNALPAAAAVELVHNFSLIHDDIEDKSELRRGRKTVWKLWGMEQAINLGDAMFALAHLAILRLEETVSAQIALRAARLLQQTCLELTQGQYLDMSYEKKTQLSLADYWPMVNGKTAALLAACTELGAMSARADPQNIQEYREFGRCLGLAFQVQDDFLGIWGDAALMGKSAESDLLTGKKSLPVLYGLEQNGAFARRFRQGGITIEEIPNLARQLEEEGGLEFTRQTAARLTEEALEHLAAANALPAPKQALEELAFKLSGRNG